MSNVEQIVTDIIADVKQRGDDAVLEYTERFDNTSRIEVTKEDIKQAYENTPDELVNALKYAAARLADYHKRCKPKDEIYEDEQGNTLGWRWTAIDKVGLYAPGGKASYPSTVLHNAIPARAAGVKHITLTVPKKDGELSPAVLVAADIANVDKIYTIGGAQAIAALAHGTKNIEKVDFIAGPGNAFVNEAKRQVYGLVGIDTLAGPSDVTVVSDDKNTPKDIALQLLAQAEHDEIAIANLICFDEEFAIKVKQAVNLQLVESENQIAGASWKDNGKIFVVKSLEEAADRINDLAPEHLMLRLDSFEANDLKRMVRHAGAIFVGRYTEEALGDYVLGASHTLPTNSSARFSGGLWTGSFMKRSSIAEVKKEAHEELAKHSEIIAKAEGLHFHAKSVEGKSSKG